MIVDVYIRKTSSMDRSRPAMWYSLLARFTGKQTSVHRSPGAVSGRTGSLPAAEHRAQR